MLFGLILIALMLMRMCDTDVIYRKGKTFYHPFIFTGIALQEGLPCGEIILTGAVIAIIFTAPVGGILMDCFYPKLLIKDTDLF